MTRTHTLAAALLATVALTGCQSIWNVLTGGPDEAPTAIEEPLVVEEEVMEEVPYCEASLTHPEPVDGAYDVSVYCYTAEPVEGIDGNFLIEGDVEAELARMANAASVEIDYYGYIPPAPAAATSTTVPQPRAEYTPEVPAELEEDWGSIGIGDYGTIGHGSGTGETTGYGASSGPGRDPASVVEVEEPPEPGDVQYDMPALPPEPGPPVPVEDVPVYAYEGPDDRLNEVATLFGWDDEQMRSIGESFGGDKAALDAFLDQFLAMETDNIAAADAGNTYNELCQAELGNPGQLLVTCRDTMTEQFRQTEVPIEGDPVTTLRGLARELGGERFDIGIMDAALCIWEGLPYDPDGYHYTGCPYWEGRYSELAREAAEQFDTGRIAHHAPEEMVLDQPYFLEVAIQPLQRNSDIEAVDTALMSTMGTGLAPGIEAPALSLSFDTIKASNVMSAKAIGTGYDIVATTPEEQVLIAGEPTVWQWQVTPKQAGTPILTFTVSQSVEVNGRNLSRAVKTIPLSVKVTPLDDLLADPGVDIASAPVPDGGAGIMGSQPSNNTLTSSLADSSGGGAPVVMARGGGTTRPDTEIPGCTWSAGPDPDRQALVLSNLAYAPPVSRLSVTHEDGVRMTTALNQVGFSVLHCEDLGQRSTVRALSMLGRMAKARKDQGAHPVTFFYYSGHGVNIDGTNFILPTDILGASPDDIRDGGVSFEDIFNRVSSTVAPTSFVVFDACRTVMDDESRGLMRAYSPVGWASGVFQAFATEPGKTAADDGVYSEELASLMQSLSDPANVVFKRVQDAVAARTGQKQRPVYTDGTTGGDFYFKQQGAE